MAHQIAAEIEKQHGRAEQAEETSNADGVEKYMAKLYTYLLALGIAGSGKVQGAPEEELFGSDSTKFVKAPWDILQAYYFRALRLSKLVSKASRLAWLRERDTAERAAWVSRFHNGNESLGEVVKAVMDIREAHWLNPLRHDVTSECPASHTKQPKASHAIKTQSQYQQEPPALPIPAKSSEEAPSDQKQMTPTQQRQSGKSKQHSKPPLVTPTERDPSTPIITSRVKATRQTEYGTSKDHNGEGIKMDSRSLHDKWPKNQGIKALDQRVAKYGWQKSDVVYTRQPAPSEAPTGGSWASTIQQHSSLPPSTNMGNAAAHRGGPPYNTVATSEPSSHSIRLKAWEQVEAAGSKHASSWKQEIKNAKNQAWSPQHPPPLTSSSSQQGPCSTAVILQDKDPSPYLGLCQDFNVGDCRGVISASAKGYGPLCCYRGWHRCAEILENGLYCGMPCHGARKHHEAERPFAYIKPGGHLAIVCNTLEHTRKEGPHRPTNPGLGLQIP